MNSPALASARLARPDEYGAVADLVKRSFLAGPYGHVHATPERVALESDSAGRAAAGALLVVADADGRLIGTASLLRAGSPQTRLALDGEAELRLVGVDPDTQNRGVGDALVAGAIAEARRWGAKRLMLDTGDLNVRAQRLYLRFGFQRALDREAPSSDGIVSYVYAFDLERTDGILVRLVRNNEIDSVGALTELAYTNDYTDLPDDYRSSLRDVADRAREHEVWVAEDIATGEILGTVSTPRPGAWISGLGQPGELDFRLLAVAPTARGRGIGELLTRHVLTLARERGLENVVMNSGPEMLGAHRLYDRMGFTRRPDRFVTFTSSNGPITLLTFAKAV